MKRHINAGALLVGDFCATVQTEIDVRLAQQPCGDSTLFQFLAQLARQVKRNVFFHQFSAEGCASVSAAMAGVDHYKKLWRALLAFSGRHGSLRWRWRRCNLRSLRLQRTGLAIIAAGATQSHNCQNYQPCSCFTPVHKLPDRSAAWDRSQWIFAATPRR